MPAPTQDLFDPRPGVGYPRGLPQVELVTGDLPAPAPRRGALALLGWFLAVFTLIALPLTAWNLSRPPVYRAAATVLTSLPQGRSDSGLGDAGLQHVAIQGQVLLGRGLLEATLARLRTSQPETAAGLTDPEDLRALLAVEPVPATNLIELSASGGEPALLAAAVNAWLAAYQDLRQREIATRVGDRLTRLDDEASALGEQVRAKRAAIDAFRERFDILTLARDNNQAIQRLADLQAALAKAEDAAIAARARQQALQAAIGNGEAVVSEHLAAALTDLRQQAAEVRVQVDSLRERYTEMFIQNDPNKRVLPERLKQIEAQIATLTREGRDEASAAARREVETATGQVLRLQRELSAQRAAAARFSTGYAEYQALSADLEALEQMQRAAATERVETETRALAGYPQIEVIEPAYPPRDPVSPHYGRDLGYTLALATAAGLLTLLALSLGGRRARPAAAMTGVRVYAAGPVGERLPQWQQTALEATPTAAALAGPMPKLVPRQLLAAEVEALWGLAGNPERQLIGLLLCGLGTEEAGRLDCDTFDLEGGRLCIPGRGAREIALPPRLCEMFAKAEPLPAWAGETDEVFADLIHRIPLLASDAGIAHPDEVDAGALRDSYLIYLVRQGARLTELERIAGPLDSAGLRRYAPYSPPGAARPLAELALRYPLFH